MIFPVKNMVFLTVWLDMEWPGGDRKLMPFAMLICEAEAFTVKVNSPTRQVEDLDKN